MVPASIRLVDALPLTPNGKVDRAALAAPVPPRAPDTRPGAPPQIREVLQQILGTDVVGDFDDFFAVGGNSVLAALATARLRESVLPGLTLNDFLRHPSAAGLATLMP